MEYAPLRIGEREFVIAMKLSHYCMTATDVPEDIRVLAKQFSHYSVQSYLSDAPRPYVKELSNEQKLALFSAVYPQESMALLLGGTNKEFSYASGRVNLLWGRNDRLMNLVQAATGVIPEPQPHDRHLMPTHPKWDRESKTTIVAAAA